jgi:hypothetical protein
VNGSGHGNDCTSIRGHAEQKNSEHRAKEKCSHRLEGYRAAGIHFSSQDYESTLFSVPLLIVEIRAILLGFLGAVPFFAVFGGSVLLKLNRKDKGRKEKPRQRRFSRTKSTISRLGITPSS